jgi:hypothetical protein
VFGERGGHLREGDHDLRAKVRWGAKRLTPSRRPPSQWRTIGYPTKGGRLLEYLCLCLLIRKLRMCKGAMSSNERQ